MADCGELSSEGSSSDTTNPAPPTPKHRRRSPAKKSLVCGKQWGEKHSHRGRKKKGKRKYMPSSAWSRNSHDSDSPNNASIKTKYLKTAPTRPGKDGKTSALFDIFQKYHPDLETMTSSCVRTISTKLFSHNLISKEVRDQVITGQDSNSAKASKVLHNVEQVLEVSPGKLRALVEVLQSEPFFDDLTKAIKSE